MCIFAYTHYHISLIISVLPVTALFQETATSKPLPPAVTSQPPLPCPTSKPSHPSFKLRFLGIIAEAYFFKVCSPYIGGLFPYRNSIHNTVPYNYLITKLLLILMYAFSHTLIIILALLSAHYRSRPYFKKPLPPAVISLPESQGRQRRWLPAPACGRESDGAWPRQSPRRNR